MRYLDKDLSPIQRAEALISEMDIQEKMGQLVCWLPQKLGEYDALKKDYPHGAGQISCLEMRMLDTLEDAARLQREVQERVMELSAHHIPAIFHMEGLCGAFIQGAVSFPSGIGRASSWNPELEEQVGSIVGRQERAAGISQTFAPVLDISRDSRMGRQGETYGEDPTLSAAMGTAYTRGVQQETPGHMRTEAVAKHFLGFHASEGGIHGTSCDISPHQLREIYGKPFQSAITEAGLKGIMPCYNSINGEPVSASAEIMTKLLREEMGFDGLVVSDYCAVMNIHGTQKVFESFTEAGLRAMEAGMDMELHFKKCFNEELAQWFESGKADIAILDRAVLRVLTAKFRMGLFEHPYALQGEKLYKEFFADKDKAVSLKSARESLVLLKNDGVLPLSKNKKKIAVIGCHAADAKILYGGYTHFSMAEGTHAAVATMAGLQTGKDGERYEIKKIPGTSIQQDAPIFDEELKKQNPDVKSMLETLRNYLPDWEITYSYGYPIAGNDMSHHDEALQAAMDADIVILTVGGKHGTSSVASMGEGIDATDIGLPLCQEKFIQKLGDLGKPFAAVHFNGRPVSSDVLDRYAGAILEAWNPAEMGAEAIAEVLLGDYNPGGKLPVSVARNAGQIPIYYNHPNGSSYHQGESIGFADYVDCPHSPRYYFGHGLSYTSFSYSDLQLSTSELEGNEKLELRVTVENTGEYAGDEVVQLYIKDEFASMTRPVMELQGFHRLHLQTKEKQTVIFNLSLSQLAFLDKDMRWKVEAGSMRALVGSSSNDIRAEEAFRIMSDCFVDGKNRGFAAKVHSEGDL